MGYHRNITGDNGIIHGMIHVPLVNIYSLPWKTAHEQFADLAIKNGGCSYFCLYVYQRVAQIGLMNDFGSIIFYLWLMYGLWMFIDDY